MEWVEVASIMCGFSIIVQELKINAGLNLLNFTKNQKSTILSETIHNASRVTITVFMRSLVINHCLIRSFFDE